VHHGDDEHEGQRADIGERQAAEQAQRRRPSHRQRGKFDATLRNIGDGRRECRGDADLRDLHRQPHREQVVRE